MTNATGTTRRAAPRPARTPAREVRIPKALEQAARAGHPGLANLTPSALIRVGLAVLAGRTLAAAVAAESGRPNRPGRYPLPEYEDFGEAERVA